MIARCLVIAMLAVLAGCTQLTALQTWNPDRARSDAERDIAAGRIRFAYVGGRAAYPPGNLPEHSGKVVRRYPILEVGDLGCEQDEGFDIREKYAARYNETMWQYVSTTRH